MEESEIKEWRRKLSEALRARPNGDLVSSGIPPLTEAEETSQGGLAWTCQVVRLLRDNLSEEYCIEVLNRCAHVMPEERIASRHELYQRTKDLELVHRFCQEDFLEKLAMWYPDMPQEWLDHIKREGWGEAGRLEGDRIIATKIPADLEGYFLAKTREDRRKAYCHCDRIREVFEQHPNPLLPLYCNCGAGFYRSNWERILGAPVHVKIIRSLLQGDDVCQFEIVLPKEVLGHKKNKKSPSS